MQPRAFDRQHFAPINTESPRNMNIRSRRSMAGFTLIEVLIVSVLVAVLAAIALPSYMQQVREGRRTEARGMLLDVMNREHRFFADNFAYTTNITESVTAVTPGLGFDPAQSENGHYALTVTLIAATGQVILTATAQGGQAADSDCATLTVSTTGARGSTGGGSKCW